MEVYRIKTKQIFHLSNTHMLYLYYVLNIRSYNVSGLPIRNLNIWFIKKYKSTLYLKFFQWKHWEHEWNKMFWRKFRKLWPGIINLNKIQSKFVMFHFAVMRLASKAGLWNCLLQSSRWTPAGLHNFCNLPSANFGQLKQQTHLERNTEHNESEKM